MKFAQPSSRVSWRGLKISLRTSNPDVYWSDRAAFLQAIVVSEYTPLIELIRAGDFVVDCGANIGCFTVYASRLVGRDGKVIAIEPEPRNFEQLRLNLAQNDCRNVITLAAALAPPAVTESTIYGTGVTASFVPNGRPGTIVRTIDMKGLLDFAGSGRIGAMKVDIEGGEEPVMSDSGFAELMARVDAIAIEVHSSNAAKLAACKLADAGLDVFDMHSRPSGIRRVATAFLRSPLAYASLPLVLLRFYGRDTPKVMTRLIKETLTSTSQFEKNRAFQPFVIFGTRSN